MPANAHPGLAFVAVAALVLLPGCASTHPGVMCPEGAQAEWGAAPLVQGQPNGLVAACKRADGTQHGPTLAWLDGRLWSVGHFADGKLHGSLVVWYATGHPLLIAEYRVGEQIATFQWDEETNRVYESTREPKSDRTTARAWYPSGGPKSRFEFAGGEIDGAYESWYESGRPKARGQYLEGRRHGTWTCWDESGEHSVVAEFVEGTAVSHTGDVSNEEAMRLCTTSPCQRFNETTAGRCGPADGDAWPPPRPNRTAEKARRQEGKNVP